MSFWVSINLQICAARPRWLVANSLSCCALVVLRFIPVICTYDAPIAYILAYVPPFHGLLDNRLFGPRSLWDSVGTRMMRAHLCLCAAILAVSVIRAHSLDGVAQLSDGMFYQSLHSHAYMYGPYQAKTRSTIPQWGRTPMRRQAYIRSKASCHRQSKTTLRVAYRTVYLLNKMLLLREMGKFISDSSWRAAELMEASMSFCLLSACR